MTEIPITPYFCTACRQTADKPAPACPVCGVGLLVRVLVVADDHHEQAAA